MLKYKINCHTKINLQIIIPNVIKSALGDIYNVTSNISAVTCKTMSTNSSRLKTRHCSAIVTWLTEVKVSNEYSIDQFRNEFANSNIQQA